MGGKNHRSLGDVRFFISGEETLEPPMDSKMDFRFDRPRLGD